MSSKVIEEFDAVAWSAARGMHVLREAIRDGWRLVRASRRIDLAVRAAGRIALVAAGRLEPYCGCLFCQGRTDGTARLCLGCATRARVLTNEQLVTLYEKEQAERKKR
jgi:hypothetical protein